MNEWTVIIFLSERVFILCRKIPADLLSYEGDAGASVEAKVAAVEQVLLSFCCCLRVLSKMLTYFILIVCHWCTLKNVRNVKDMIQEAKDIEIREAV